MITCPKCTKDNQDHYKFCLGCGAELPRDAAPKPFSPQTPPHGVQAPLRPLRRPASAAPGLARRPSPAVAASAAGAFASPRARCQRPRRSRRAARRPPPPQRPPAAGIVACPQCGHINAPTNLFCGSCGFRLGGARAPAPAAPAAAPRRAAAARRHVVLTALRADGTEAGTYHAPRRQRSPSAATPAASSPATATSRRATRPSRQRGRARSSSRTRRSLNGVYKKLARDVPGRAPARTTSSASGRRSSTSSRSRRSPRRPTASSASAPGEGLHRPHRARHRPRRDGQRLPDPGDAASTSVASAATCSSPKTATSPASTAASRGRAAQLFLTDLGSSNGTFIRLREETEVTNGDVLLMGQQLFRVAM